MDTKTQRNIKRVKNTDIDRETAERKAAELPPKRSDRWQAKFHRNFAQSDTYYGQPR